MSDVYGAISDDAIQRIINDTHVKAPFLFNYVAPSIRFVQDDAGRLVDTEELWVTCSPVEDSPLDGEVPRFTRMQPFSLPGIPVKLPYCIQIIDAALDFHPGNIIALPPELPSPLSEQNFSMSAMVQFGMACIPDKLSALQPIPNLAKHVWRLPVLPVTELVCFTLNVFAFGRVTVTPENIGAGIPFDRIGLAVGGIEIVDIEPRGLENVVECYLIAMLKSYVLPKLILSLEDQVVKSLGLTVTSKLTAGLPDNPAIEENELRIWLDVKVI
ncbi:hypothetical protein [Foetidibacter luteolus]|uniref:hypothetical protein n=1 Tax=Foetidibacter luteolus TaxID=2608880 RepID=UPI00129AF8CC|nr:hypothetical protein [Foetidibacter luteolus]